jgi:hypothetical protein
MMPCSDRGELNTLSIPYLSQRPVVQRKTPPNLTSSPNTLALSENEDTWGLFKGQYLWLSLLHGIDSNVCVVVMEECL